MLFTTPVTANTTLQCIEKEVGVRNLAVNHGETPRVRGLDKSGQLLEIYANEETGSWTLTVTTQRNTICEVSHGEYFTLVRELFKEGELN